MNKDLFEFWAEAKQTNFEIHPEDIPALERFKSRYGSAFPLDTLVGPLMGRARDAPIVLLYANGRRSPEDYDPEWKARLLPDYANQLSGGCPLPEFIGHPARGWIEKMIKSFGLDYSAAREKIAFLNIVPYKTLDISGWGRRPFDELLNELPSVRAMRHWVGGTLIPEAIAGKRLVVCLRSARLWGLRSGDSPNGGLFTPTIIRSGVVPLADRPAIHEFMRDRLGINVGMPAGGYAPKTRGSPGASIEPTKARSTPILESDIYRVPPPHQIGAHDAAWRRFREGRLIGSGATRLTDAVVTGIFPERQRVKARWRKELFALYHVGQTVGQFVQAGRSLVFDDPKGYAKVTTESQVLDHVCWDVTGGFITIDPKFP